MSKSPEDILAVKLNPEAARNLLAAISAPDEILDAELEILGELDYLEDGYDDLDC